MRLTSTRIEPFINSIELRLGRARGIGGVARAARRSHLIATSMAGEVLTGLAPLAPLAFVALSRCVSTVCTWNGDGMRACFCIIICL